MTPEQSAAVARLNKFLHQRLHVRGFDQDEIVSLYLGDTERGAVLKASDVHALLAALDEAQADAARFEFLCHDFSPMGLDINGNHSWAYRRNFSLRGPNMRAAIDAARAGEKP